MGGWVPSANLESQRNTGISASFPPVTQPSVDSDRGREVDGDEHQHVLPPARDQRGQTYFHVDLAAVQDGEVFPRLQPGPARKTWGPAISSSGGLVLWEREETN